MTVEATKVTVQQSTKPDKVVGRLGAGTGITLGGRVLGRGLHLVTQVLLARILPIHAFGLFAIGFTILRMVSLIAPMGLQNGVIYLGIRNRDADGLGIKNVILIALGIAAAIGTAFGAATWFLASWLANDVFNEPGVQPVIRGLAPAFALVATLKIAAAGTRISQHMKYGVIAEDIVQPATNVLLLLVVLIAGWGLSGAVSAVVGSFAISLITALYFLTSLYPGLLSWAPINKLSIAGELIRYSIPAAFAGVLGTYILWIDRLFIAYYRPATEAGVYHALSQFAIVFAIILHASNTACQPLVAKLYHQMQLSQLNTIFKVSTKWGMYFSLPLFVIIITVPTELMGGIFGNAYEVGASALVVLASAQLINVSTGGVGMMLIMTGHQRQWFITSLVCFVVALALNVKLIPLYGVMGAAIATLIAFIVLFSVGLGHVWYRLKAWPYDRRYLKGIASAILSGLCALGVRQVASSSHPLVTVATVTMVVFAVFTISLVVLGIDDEDREFLRSVSQRIIRSTGERAK